MPVGAQGRIGISISFAVGGLSDGATSEVVPLEVIGPLPVGTGCVLHSAAVQFLNPPSWDGKPYILAELFVLKKGQRTSRCAVQTHPLRLELRLSVGN